MTEQEAKDYVNQRFKEIELENPVQKVNIIIGELNREGFAIYLHETMPYVINKIGVEEGTLKYYV